MKCAHRPVRPLPVRPGFVCKDGPVLRLDQIAASARRQGDLTMACERRPRLAVWKFASCDGCQLSLLDCEDELLAVAGAVEIAYFPEATSAVVPGPYDLSLVEGSITTAHDAERIQEMRRAVAASGHHRRLRHLGRHPGPAQFRATCRNTSRRSTPRPSTSTRWPPPRRFRAHVKVDFELRGCPINKAAAARGDQRLPGRAQAGASPRTACAWSASGAAKSASWWHGHALPGAGDACGLRRDMPGL